MMLFGYAATKASFVGPSHRQQEAGGGDGREEVGIGRVGLLSLLRRCILGVSVPRQSGPLSSAECLRAAHVPSR